MKSEKYCRDLEQALKEVKELLILSSKLADADGSVQPTHITDQNIDRLRQVLDRYDKADRKLTL